MYLIVAVRRPGIGVLITKPRGRPSPVPDVERRTDRGPITGRGSIYSSLERRLGEDRPFATAFSATPPARQRFCEPVSLPSDRVDWRYASSSLA